MDDFDMGTEEQEAGRIIWCPPEDENVRLALLAARARVHDIPAPPTQSTTSAKALVTRAQQVEGSSGSSSSLGICRRNARRHRSMSSATSGRTSASPRLGPSRSLAEPYPSLNSTHAGQALATSATNQDSPGRSTLSTSTSTSSSAGSSRLEILLNLVQANSASRVERRAQRQRSMEVAQKANEQMRRQAFEKGLLQRREDHVRRPYHDEDDRRTGFEVAARGSSEEPRSRTPTNIDARKTTLQPTRSLPIISELPSIVIKPPIHQPPPAIRSPENRSSQQSWAGGVKPCGLRGGGIPRGRSVGAVSSGGDGVGQRAGKDSVESSPAAPRLCRPFKAPTMMNRRPIVQDQNSMEVEPDRKRSNTCSVRGVAAAVITKSAAEARFPQRPPPQPLADRSRHLNSNNTSTSTSTSTLASTTCEATDTGNDSFDDDTADMEGLLMEGGEEVEALLRACDGALS